MTTGRARAGGEVVHLADNGEPVGQILHDARVSEGWRYEWRKGCYWLNAPDGHGDVVPDEIAQRCRLADGTLSLHWLVVEMMLAAQTKGPAL